MSSKSKWAESAKQFVNSAQNRGRVPPPKPCPNVDPEVQSYECTPDLSTSEDERAQHDLLKALISSQKQTIDNFQKDLHFERNKILELEGQVRKLHAEAKSQADYHSLKKQSLLGFQGGYEKGMSKVKSFVNFSFSYTYRFSSYGRTNLMWNSCIESRPPLD